MAPVGPRLDRPSAVGDEGRPRATSLGIAAVLVVALAIAVGVAQGEPGFFTGFALLAGLCVAGMALIDRDRLRDAVVGHLCFLPAASVLAVVVVLSGGHPLLVAGVVAALTGTAAAWADVGDADQLGRTLGYSVLAYAFGLVGLVVTGVLLLVGLVAWGSLTALAGGAGPAASLLGLSVLLAAASGSLLLALYAVPVVELAPRHRKSAVARRVGRHQRRIATVAVGSIAAAEVGAFLAVVGVLEPMASAPPVRAALGVLATPVVVGPLVGLAAVSVLAALLVAGARRATVEYDAASTRAIAAGLGAAGHVAFLAIIAVSGGFLWNWGLVLLVFAAVALPVLVTVVLLVAFVAVRVGLVDGRAAPVALAAVGLVSVAVGAAAGGLPAVVVFAAVGAALVVWDVGSFGLGVTAELGHRPATRRLELYHGVFALGVGLGTVILATAAEAVRGLVATGFGTHEAMAVAVVGVLLLLAPLRG